VSRYATQNPDADDLMAIIGKAKESAEKAGFVERANARDARGPSPEPGRVQPRREEQPPTSSERPIARAPSPPAPVTPPRGQKRVPGGPIPGGEVREIRPGVTRPLHLDDANGLVRWYPPESLNEEPIFDGAIGEQIDTLRKELAVADRFVAAGIDAPTRVLFTGDPGTGKTLCARWLGAKLGMPVAVVKIANLMGTKYMGETSAGLGKVFKVAEDEMGLLFIDEIDGVAFKREGAGNQGADNERKTILTTLLQLIEAIAPERPIIAATNVPKNLDPALLSRMTTQIEFSLPTPAARLRMVERWLAGLPPTHPATTAEKEDLVAKSEGKGGRELRGMTMALGRKILMGPARFGGLFPEESRP